MMFCRKGTSQNETLQLFSYLKKLAAIAASLKVKSLRSITYSLAET